MVYLLSFFNHHPPLSPPNPHPIHADPYQILRKPGDHSPTPPVTTIVWITNDHVRPSRTLHSGKVAGDSISPGVLRVLSYAVNQTVSETELFCVQ